MNIDVFKAFLFMSVDLVLLIYLAFCIDRSFRRLWKFINLVLLFSNVGLIHLRGIVLAASISLLMVQSHDLGFYYTLYVQMVQIGVILYPFFIINCSYDVIPLPETFRKSDGF